ncbi:hypothetical protein ACHEXK_08420 [Limnohabitans sp. DCL3]|uniref:hypothetical protein n=1 Tax=Limnohabitans sp. DCL3 TaxID=3374103 RepID=UPI003A843553
MADTGPALTPSTRGPNCWQCRHFAITHLPFSPYACRAMGFQSRLLPSIEVLRIDGRFCRLHAPKSPPPKA